MRRAWPAPCRDGAAGRGAAPGGGGGGGGTTPGDPRPVSSLSSASRQDVDRLFVRASMNEPGTLTATATVNVPGAAKVLRFKQVRREVAANTAVKLRLKLAKKNLRAVKRALRTRRLKAKVAVTARDSAGQSSVRRQTIRLTR